MAKATGKNMKEGRLWVPIRDGTRYCSPGCGRRCTYKEFELATARAKALAERLGVGWETDVWENLGWHYCVIAGDVLTVHAMHHQGAVSYTASGGGVSATSEDPKTALILVRDSLKQKAAEAQHLIARMATYVQV